MTNTIQGSINTYMQFKKDLEAKRKPIIIDVPADASEAKTSKIAKYAGIVWDATKKVVGFIYNGLKKDIAFVGNAIRKHKWETATVVGSAVVGGVATTSLVGAGWIAAAVAMVAILTIHFLIAKRKKQAMDWRRAILSAMVSSLIAGFLPVIALYATYWACIGLDYVWVASAYAYLNTAALFVI
ncbi:TRAP dicarboxylate transporter subunit DctM [Paenibacillus sp. TCA20]|uniref:hypothetical protein n=1 Tax=Paenibacillus sp. TCA20 TaxID=1499968 RepID=UPI0004D3F285|nr:hypothetical protein [Paenibacillus sp. TCA20]GAK42010.1 TRAP dicarboxylate transporter subunit DctM [Paenibacillus sp. TCA20]